MINYKALFVFLAVTFGLTLAAPFHHSLDFFKKTGLDIIILYLSVFWNNKIPYMILLLTFVTLVAAPVFKMILSLVEEMDWRGLLLPTLEPIGKMRVMVISGVICAL